MRIGEKIYYCSKLSSPDTDGNEYAEPVEIILTLGKFTVMERTGNSVIDRFGLNIDKQMTGIAQPYTVWNGVIKVNDLFYLDGNAPDEDTEEYYGQNANYRVSNVANGNALIKYTFEKIGS